MANDVKAIPDGYSGASPYLSVDGGAAAIDFYKNAFGATEVMRLNGPQGTIAHAEIRIGAASIMVADAAPSMNFLSPKTLGGTPVTIHMYVEDVDAMAERAVAAGAKLLGQVEDQFYGDRGGRLEDPFGHIWWIATRKENLSPEEMKKRMEALFGASKE